MLVKPHLTSPSAPEFTCSSACFHLPEGSPVPLELVQLHKVTLVECKIVGAFRGTSHSMENGNKWKNVRPFYPVGCWFWGWLLRRVEPQVPPGVILIYSLLALFSSLPCFHHSLTVLCGTLFYQLSTPKSLFQNLPLEKTQTKALYHFFPLMFIMAKGKCLC